MSESSARNSAKSLSVVHPTGPSALDKLRRHGAGMSVGVELPLDNDFAAHRASELGAGVPDLTHHRFRAQLADKLGYKALWLRDVPLWIPGFGDAGQVFDPFAYLGYLAGVTEDILLGTAAVVLPLRHPLHVAKIAATVDQLSAGRLILGVASGDRPREYPAFGIDFEGRGEQYRKAVADLRRVWHEAADPQQVRTKILPVPYRGRIPLLAVGRGQQSTDWIAQNMDGYMTYHRPPDLMKQVTDKWKHSVPHGQTKPAMMTMRIDLHEHPDARPEPIKFGARMGRNTLLEYFHDLESVGIDHVALSFRPNSRPVDDALEEIAEYVLPSFSSAPGAD